MNTLSLLLTGHTTAPTALLTPLLLHNDVFTMSTATITRTPTDLQAFYARTRQSTISRDSTREHTPTQHSRSSSRSSTASSRSSVTIRPGHRRSYSKDSSGWYNAEENMTLEDFEERLKTLEKRVEKFVSVCATNIVMALLRPTPLVLFLFNPVSLMVVGLMVLVWVVGRGVVG